MISLTLAGFAFYPFAWFTAIMNKYYLEPFTLAFMITEKETPKHFYHIVQLMQQRFKYHTQNILKCF
uniref:Uncharacterized protein n=1 Tax=Glossina palpalis gambiensis TaxID=67801 RepID=A0A1B0B034_9MUSC